MTSWVRLLTAAAEYLRERARNYRIQNLQSLRRERDNLAGEIVYLESDPDRDADGARRELLVGKLGEVDELIEVCRAEALRGARRD